MAAVTLCTPCSNGNYHSRCRRKSHGRPCDCQQCFPTPIARTDDPVNAHVGAAQIEPSRYTTKAALLAHLQDRPGVWVSPDELREVAGDQYSRRARELRAAGWPLETEKIESRSWHWRIKEEA